MVRLVPLSFTVTTFNARSNSPVTVAFGAFARSQLLKSLRSAASCARYAFTVVLLKLIFLPGAGRVLL